MYVWTLGRWWDARSMIKFGAIGDVRYYRRQRRPHGTDVYAAICPSFVSSASSTRAALASLSKLDLLVKCVRAVSLTFHRSGHDAYSKRVYMHQRINYYTGPRARIIPRKSSRILMRYEVHDHPPP